MSNALAQPYLIIDAGGLFYLRRTELQHENIREKSWIYRVQSKTNRFVLHC